MDRFHTPMNVDQGLLICIELAIIIALLSWIAILLMGARK